MGFESLSLRAVCQLTECLIGRLQFVIHVFHLFAVVVIAGQQVVQCQQVLRSGDDRTDPVHRLLVVCVQQFPHFRL